MAEKRPSYQIFGGLPLTDAMTVRLFDTVSGINRVVQVQILPRPNNFGKPRKDRREGGVV